MTKPIIRLLMIEDTTVQARLVQKLLSTAKNVTFEYQWVMNLTDGLKQLAENNYDIVLTDLQLPEGYGLESFRMVQEHALDLPIVLLTNIEDEIVALKAIAAGAQDYLIKSQIDAAKLERALRYALERHKLVAELRTRYEARIEELQGATAR